MNGKKVQNKIIIIVFLLNVLPYFNYAQTTISLSEGAIRYQLNSQNYIILQDLEIGVKYNYWIDNKSSQFVAITHSKTMFLPSHASIFTINAQKLSNKSVHKSKNGLMTNPNIAEEALINDIFIGGECFDITNITARGDSKGMGYFSHGESTIDIEEGVILSTGNVTTAIGPNVTTNTSAHHTSEGTDYDLAIATGNDPDDLYDIVALEFDFTPTVDFVSFEYVFASEEYCEYVGSQYNDVFGFFISGPGINGPFSNNSQNIATIPNTDIYVGINSINHTSFSSYFNVNHSNCGSSALFSDGIEYDGFTSILTASSLVIPCETYHIKLIIADVSDKIYDSAVFLKAKGFQAGEPVGVSAYSEVTQTNEIPENCGNAQFIFQRINEDLSQDLNIDFVVSLQSTAIPDVDYQSLPSFVTIPANESSFTLYVPIYNDNLIEGTETLIIELSSACSCLVQEATLSIFDIDPLEGTIQIESSCLSEPAYLSSEIEGGYGDINYAWSNGQTIQNFIVEPPHNNSEISYFLIASDACDNEIIIESNLHPFAQPEAFITGKGFLCPDNPNETVEITITLEGFADEWEFSYSINGQTQEPIVTSDPTYTLITNQIGNYQLDYVQHSNGTCIGTVGGLAQVLSTELPTGYISGDGQICGNNENSSSTIRVDFTGQGSWHFEILKNNLPYDDLISNQNPFFYEVDEIGLYTIQNIRNVDGYCQGFVSGQAFINETVIQVDISSQDLTCYEDNTGSININPTGGQEPYFFEWSNSSLQGNSISALQSGDYLVTIYDSDGCFAQVETNLNQPLPLSLDHIVIQPVCEGELGSVDIVNPSGGSEPYLYTIDGGENWYNFFDFDNLSPQEYHLGIQDINGCQTFESIEVLNPTIIDLWIESEQSLSYGDSQELKLYTNVDPFLIDTIVWSPSETLSCSDCMSPIATPSQTTQYHVTLHTRNGCADSTNILIRLDLTKLPIFIPNAFSPNEDGNNDIFLIYGNEKYVKSVDLIQIYNRWGNLVFEIGSISTNKEKYGWDGKIGDENAQQGVYAYIVQVTFFNGITKIYTGDLNLIR